jgi:hypothetical protein
MIERGTKEIKLFVPFSSGSLGLGLSNRIGECSHSVFYKRLVTTRIRRQVTSSIRG